MARETTHENINKQSTFRIFHFMKQIVNENQTLRFKNNRKVLFQFPIGRLPFFFLFFLNNICTISYIYFRQRLLFVSEKSLCLRRDFSIKTCSVYFYLHFCYKKSQTINAFWFQASKRRRKYQNLIATRHEPDLSRLPWVILHNHVQILLSQFIHEIKVSKCPGILK